jgi:hypothetical protein
MEGRFLIRGKADLCYFITNQPTLFCGFGFISHFFSVMQSTMQFLRQ